MKPDEIIIEGEEAVNHTGRREICYSIVDFLHATDYQKWSWYCRGDADVWITEYVGWVWLHPKFGAFPKRLAKKARHAFGAAIPGDALSRIGKIAKESISRQYDGWILEISRCIDWTDGEFGDEGSCFWGCRNGARAAIEDAGGGSLKLYDSDENPAARCLWVPYKGQVVLFNAYANCFASSVSLETFAGFLAKHRNATYKKVGVDNHGKSDGLIYLNSSRCFVVGGEDELEKIDYCYLQVGNEEGCCDYCENYVDADDMYTAPNGALYCEHCFNHRCFICCACGEVAWWDQSAELNGDYFCLDCAHSLGYQCENCGNWYLADNHPSYPVMDRDEVWCDGCVDRYCFFCEDCDDCFTDRYIREIGNAIYCLDCAQNHTEEEEEEAA